MRRLPIFFLLDVSESMVGESLRKLEQGLAAVVSRLRKDPYVLETAFLSVIAFAGKPRTVIQLTDVITFRPPDLPVGGGTALGAALGHLMDEIERTVARTTPDQKGDWKPVVFLLTDGPPTDDPAKAVERWNRSYRNRASLVAVSIGGTADHALLKKLTEDVIIFNDAAPDAFARFLWWIGTSIRSQSRGVPSGRNGRVALARPEPGLLATVETAEGMAPYAGVDDRYAVLVCKCMKTKLPYLVKYERHAKGAERKYKLVASVPVTDSYFKLSDSHSSGSQISMSDLDEVPSCPHCRAKCGVAHCKCGNIHCLDPTATQSSRTGDLRACDDCKRGLAAPVLFCPFCGHAQLTRKAATPVDRESDFPCPWCGKLGHYELANIGLNVGRGHG